MVNLEITRAVAKLGGRVLEGRQRDNGQVLITCGRDSTQTTLYILRHARTAIRRHGNIGIIIDSVSATPGDAASDIWAVEQRLTLVLPTAATGRWGELIARAASADHQLVSLHRRPGDSHEAASRKVRQRLQMTTTAGYLDSDNSIQDIERQLWTLAENAADEGAVVGVLRDRPKTRAALRAVLPRLEHRGYRFVAAASLLP